MDSAWQDLVVNLIYTALLASIPALVGIVVLYIKKKLNLSQQQELSNIVKTVVSAAEQYGASHGMDSAAKMQWAIDKLQEYGLKLTDDQLHTLIEEAVYQIKVQGGEIQPVKGTPGKTEPVTPPVQTIMAEIKPADAS
jgi:hypothetical protein